MIKLFLSLLLLARLVGASEHLTKEHLDGFSLGTYNVENLFDLIHNGSEYKKYIPKNRYKWDKDAYNKKLDNISKVIYDMNLTIISLIEIESAVALKDLIKKLQIKGLNYPHYTISKSKTSVVKTALLSKYNIIETKNIEVFENSRYRDILKVTLSIDNKPLTLFINHWPSKRRGESYRIMYAKKLVQELKKIDNEYIILGDLNSNFLEFKDFVKDYRLNNTKGVTGINHILKTIYKNNFITYDRFKKISDKYRYNLWAELDKSDRFSHLYRKKKNTLDSIIIPKSLIDGKDIDYEVGSFSVFKKDYIYTNNKIKRWMISNKKGHLGTGFSDHLPIYAKFRIIK